MSLEELWQLFPISLCAPKDSWSRQYADMEHVLKQALEGCGAPRISHIGSTAVHSIWSKDIVDILVEIPCDADFEAAARAIESCGFLRMAQQTDRFSFNSGYTRDGFADKVFHLHLRRAGDNDELYFRDYLMEHPAAAAEYEKLKLELWKTFEYDRDAYTEAKTAFVSRYTNAAKVLYPARYEVHETRDRSAENRCR